MKTNWQVLNQILPQSCGNYYRCPIKNCQFTIAHDCKLDDSMIHVLKYHVFSFERIIKRVSQFSVEYLIELNQLRLICKHELDSLCVNITRNELFRSKCYKDDVFNWLIDNNVDTLCIAIFNNCAAESIRHEKKHPVINLTPIVESITKMLKTQLLSQCIDETTKNINNNHNNNNNNNDINNESSDQIVTNMETIVIEEKKNDINHNNNDMGMMN